MGAIKGNPTMIILIILCLVPVTLSGNCITAQQSPDIAVSLKLPENTLEDCDPSEPYFSLIYFENSELYIGGSNAVYKVNPSTLTVESKLCLDPDFTDVVIPCDILAAQTEIKYVCENQISVIENFGDDSWLVCGSNSLNPKCWKCNSASEPWECNIAPVSSREFVPKGPRFDSTWYYDIATGLTFAATEVASFEMPFFSRLNGDFSAPEFLERIANTNANQENWLNTPAFVGKPIIRGDYTYFFFRETATEYKNAGKIVYPRVGRVCSDNEGTPKIDALGDFFQTFVKARLNCSIDLNFPFYFNEIQDIYFEEPDIVYAVFTTPSEGPPASAVCAYSMSEIAQLFDDLGRYKGQSSNDADWLPRTHTNLGSNVRFGTCGNRYSPTLLDTLNDYNLIDQLVPNLRDVNAENLGSGNLRASDSPLLYYTNYTFTSIVKVDEGEDGGPIVFMIGTNNLRILKAAYNPTMKKNEYGSIITEIMLDAEIVPNRLNEVRDMVVFKEDDSTYVIATAIADVFRLPIQFCDTYETCEECQRVQDPHCQWMDRETEKSTCTYIPSLVSIHEPVTTCPIYRGSENIDQVKSFGPAQRYSMNANHNLTYYGLLVAKKGSKLEVILPNVTNAWTLNVSNGATENTEYSSVRLTLNDGEIPENVSISVKTATGEMVWLNATMINDTSDISPSKTTASNIYKYDSALARYQYEVVEIRQNILMECSNSDTVTNVLTCPVFRFQEDTDSFTCPA